MAGARRSSATRTVPILESVTKHEVKNAVHELAVSTGGVQLGRLGDEWYVEFTDLPPGLADAEPGDLPKCRLGNTDQLLAMTPALVGFVIGKRYQYLCRVLRDRGGMP